MSMKLVREVKNPTSVRDSDILSMSRGHKRNQGGVVHIAHQVAKGEHPEFEFIQLDGRCG